MKLFGSLLESGGICSYEMNDSLQLKKNFHSLKQGRDNHVQKLCKFQYSGLDYLLIGRKGLVLDILLDDCSGLRFIKRKGLISSQVRSDFFVSIEINNEINENKELEKWIRCCTGFGYCYFIKLEKLMDSKFDDFAMSFGMSGFVGFFKMFKFNEDDDSNWKIIYGGKDRGINVFELNDHVNVWKSKSINKKTENNEHVWIENVLLIGDEFKEFKILAITKFGKILKYFPNFSKFPIDEYQIFDQLSIKNIFKLNNEIILINNGFNELILFDFKNWKLVKQFKIITGSLSVFKLVNIGDNISLIITSSNMDLNLRIYLIWEFNQNWYIKLITKNKIDGIITEILVNNTDVPMDKIHRIIHNYSNKKHHNEVNEATNHTKKSRII